MGSRHLTGSYLGGFYSLNGYYPGATGHALIANEVLTAIDLTFGTRTVPVQADQLLSADSRDILADFEDDSAHRTAAKAALIQDLNAILIREKLYDADPFKTFYMADMAKISPATKSQLKLNRSKNSVRVLLNRRLLEDVLISPLP